MAQATTARKPLAALGKAPHLVVVALVLGLLVAMVLGPTRSLLEQKHRLAGMSADLEEVESTNERLETRIERLQDPDFIEQQARAQAGLVRPGEIPFVVMPPGKAARQRQKAQAVARRAARSPAPQPGLIESFVEFIGF